MAKNHITFAGSTIGEPWWSLGEIVADVLKPQGYEVTIESESASDQNIRWISARKADVGSTTPVHLQSAMQGIHQYRGEVHRGLVSIATIKRPNWLALAVRHDLGVSNLRQLKKMKYPLRIMAPNRDRGDQLDTVLRHYGMTMEEIESWGGRFMKWSGKANTPFVWEGVVDMMLGNIYLGYTPHNWYWYQATILNDMRFLDFDKALILKLVKNFGFKRGTIPHGFFRGLDKDIPSVVADTMYIYCLESQPAKLIRLIAEGLDKNSDLFKHKRSVFYYEREEVWRNPYIPLHPAAEEYYRSKGYMK
ncbi:MAG: TAXI family TRAP transporter solute-binding subunit [Thermodesulfobacteriota bacterium]